MTTSRRSTPSTIARAEAEVSDFLRIFTPAPRTELDAAGPRVSVVIPTWNEQRNLAWLARHMPANIFEILLVDGDSTDGTVQTARELWPDVRVIHQTRRGKGNALACGFHAARGDIVVMIDADGSMDPGEIPYFVRALCAGADYAKGSRFTIGGGSSDITALRAWGNRRLLAITALLHGTTYSDLCYGYNAFWRHVLPLLDLDPGSPGEAPGTRRWGDGFEVETLINIRVHLAGLSIAEIPSYEHERLHGLSNLNTFRDGFRVLRTIAIEKVVKARRAERLAALNAGRADLLSASTLFPEPVSDDPALPLSAGEDLSAITGPDLVALAILAEDVDAIGTDDLTTEMRAAS